MCRPVGGSRAEVCPGGHIGPPLRVAGAFRSNGNWRKTMPFPNGAGRSPPPTGGPGVARRRGEVTPPYGCNTGGARRRADVPRAWLPPTKFRAEIWGVSHGHRPLRPAGDEGRHAGVVVPYGWLWRAAAIVLGSGAQRGVCGAGAKKWAGIAAEIIPKVSSNAGQSLSRPAGDSSLCTREPLGTGVRAAEVVAPYGKPNQPPKPAARSEASAPAATRNGWESAQRPSQKGGRPRDCHGSA